jgi:hypothetical protein
MVTCRGEVLPFVQMAWEVMLLKTQTEWPPFATVVIVQAPPANVQVVTFPGAIGAGVSAKSTVQVVVTFVPL